MARIGNFERDVQLVLSKTISREARQQLAAKAARKILADAQTTNLRALGVSPPHRQFVDGRQNAPLESVNPDKGTIVFEFQLMREVLGWIGEQLIINSPVLTGRYRASHILLADGDQADIDSGVIKPAQEYKFVNIVPYARKIERGLSPQAPDGVYEVLATLANRRFGNIARIKFVYTEVVGEGMLWDWAGSNASRMSGSAAQRKQHARNVRQPSILVTPR